MCYALLINSPTKRHLGSLSLLQRIFPTQESNWGLLHWRQSLYQLSYQGSPYRTDLTIFVSCVLEKGMANYFSILASRTPGTVWKGKKIGHWRWIPQIIWCPICYWRSVEKYYRKMKRWNQSKKSNQLWMWLVTEVKSDAVKSNIA